VFRERPRRLAEEHFDQRLSRRLWRRCCLLTLRDSGAQHRHCQTQGLSHDCISSTDLRRSIVSCAETLS
jgi:hypothetical protein